MLLAHAYLLGAGEVRLDLSAPLLDARETLVADLLAAAVYLVVLEVLLVGVAVLVLDHDGELDAAGLLVLDLCVVESVAEYLARHLLPLGVVGHAVRASLL